MSNATAGAAKMTHRLARAGPANRIAGERRDRHRQDRAGRAVLGDQPGNIASPSEHHDERGADLLRRANCRARQALHWAQWKRHQIQNS